MKKLISFVLALAMICGLAMSAMAAGITLSTDSDLIRAGEEVTVTVALEEDIGEDAGATMFQGELYYDTDVLTYKSHVMGEKYDHFMSKDRADKGRTQFSYVSMENKAGAFSAGTVITVVYTANENIEADALSTELRLEVDVQNNKGEAVVDATFTTSVTISNEDEPFENPFEDVIEGTHYYDAVLWAAQNGITTGKSPTIFGVGQSCTRAEFVTFLWRAAGKPAPASDENPFTDVQVNQFYTEAVLWAYEEGITTGMSATVFGVSEFCTRDQVVTFLWRYAGKPAPAIETVPFEDVEAGKHYTVPVLWAYENQITTGMSAAIFGVGEPCTRDQVVTFLYRAQK